MVFSLITAIIIWSSTLCDAVTYVYRPAASRFLGSDSLLNFCILKGP